MTNNTKLIPIVIDTSVFIHILNPERNTGRHIDILLARLAFTHQLQIDKAGKIDIEYKRKLIEVIENMDEQRFEKHTLEFWILIKQKNIIDIEPSEQLRTGIAKIINDKTKSVDRCLVATAALTTADLITNDEVDILNNATAINKEIKRNRLKKINLMNSQTAHTTYCINTN
ncbi:PIN domain-containing protein [Nostoc sp. MS1]|uniref:PIN domain-containing protein n=1 Tax=Nostoc sp. MS1 TaxID=2764711 RepID=UPI001CC36A2E|nr:PIN domain-containing protein [Nostoc sp. MS1]BCL34170.1 hypothetical protein NSMS1_06170 [Nostoc sp. MS1]